MFWAGGRIVDLDVVEGREYRDESQEEGHSKRVG